MTFVPYGLEIRRLDVEDRLVLSLHGELDLASAPGLERELRVVSDDEFRRLFIDLEGLEFMDSVGLRVLLQARQGAARAQNLTLCRPPRQVQRLIELAGLSDYFTFDET
jgi:anti-sigma B factor antagonist